MRTTLVHAMFGSSFTRLPTGNSVAVLLLATMGWSSSRHIRLQTPDSRHLGVEKPLHLLGDGRKHVPRRNAPRDEGSPLAAAPPARLRAAHAFGCSPFSAAAARWLLSAGWRRNVNSGVRLSGLERGVRGSRIRVVAQVNADYDRTKAEIAAEQILGTYPRLAGFFAASDLMALGVADAVRAAGKTGKVRIIGLDGIPEALDAVRAGSSDGTVSQYRYVIGQMAVEACVAVAGGARLPARVEAPIALLTKDNVGRAIAAFPRPFQRYSDPFAVVIRRHR